MYQFPRASVTKYYKWGGLKQWEYIKTDFQIRPHSEILRLRTCNISFLGDTIQPII